MRTATLREGAAPAVPLHLSSSSSPSSSTSSPPSSPPSMSSFPLFPLVSYNHELLKLRLAHLHTDWLYRHKLSTEKPIDEQRKAELLRGHSLHIPGWSLSNYPIRRVQWPLPSADDSSSTVESPVNPPVDVIAKEVPLTSVPPPLHRLSDSMMGASHVLFFSEEERHRLRQDSVTFRAQRATRRREREQRWKAEVGDAVRSILPPSSDPLLRGSSPSPTEERKATEAAVEGRVVSAVVASTPHRPVQSSVALSANGVGRAGVSSSPVPGGGGGALLSSGNVVALCEECGCKVDSQWSVCDFCGFDPLLADDEDDEEGGARRRKRKKVRTVQNLIAAQQTSEKKQKAREEMQKLAETMSPWEHSES